MNNLVDSIKGKILSLLSGAQYSAGQLWDGLDVWSDLSEFYRSLTDARARAAFEQVVVDFLYEDDRRLLDTGLHLCYVLQIRAAIPRLMEIIQEQPEYPLLGVVYMALERMEVPEAADLLAAAGYVYGLLRIDFQRAVRSIQHQLAEIGQAECDTNNQKLWLFQANLESAFTYLYEHFGSKGIFLLLDELEVSNKQQAVFMLNVVIKASDVTKQEELYPAPQKQLTEQEKTDIRVKHRALIDEVRKRLGFTWQGGGLRHTHT